MNTSTLFTFLLAILKCQLEREEPGYEKRLIAPVVRVQDIQCFPSLGTDCRPVGLHTGRCVKFLETRECFIHYTSAIINNIVTIIECVCMFFNMQYFGMIKGN